MRLPIKTSVRLLTILIAGVFILQACDEDDPFSVSYESAPPPFDTSEAVYDTTTSEGLQIYVIEEGTGVFEVVSRDQISLRYTGRTRDDGRIFESSYRNGSTNPGRFQNLTPSPITVPGQIRPRTISPLVKGLREGIIGMVEGEKRTIIIPPELGYGTNTDGSSGNSLSNKTLVFDVEVVNIL